MNSTNITNTTAVPFTPEGRPPPGFAPPGFTAETIVATVFFCILTSGIVFGNSLVIGAFYVNRRLRTTTNYFIMSLSVADMLIGSISVPLWVYFYITNDTAGNPVYEFWLTFDIICGVSSILNMTMISLERCYALLRPIQHRNISKSEYALYISHDIVYCFESGNRFLERMVRVSATIWLDLVELLMYCHEMCCVYSDLLTARLSW